MNRVNVVVEGQTEETFVRTVLTPYLAAKGVYAVARSVGGIGRKAYPKLKKDIQNWLKQDKTAFVTTMIDLYALPQDFPGWNAQIHDPYQRIAHLENEFANDIDIDQRRFVPNVQLHEFEAMLFCDKQCFAAYYPAQSSAVDALFNEVASFANPELINEGATTHPAARIHSHIYKYDKITAGNVIAIDIGLSKIRSNCGHFDTWVKKLEQL